MESEQPVLYYENIEGGHGGAADNKQAAHMWALGYTFLWQRLGPSQASPPPAATPAVKP
jgi:prolyl oligopeptidase